MQEIGKPDWHRRAAARSTGEEGCPCGGDATLMSLAAGVPCCEACMFGARCSCGKPVDNVDVMMCDACWRREKGVIPAQDKAVWCGKCGAGARFDSDEHGPECRSCRDKRRRNEVESRELDERIARVAVEALSKTIRAVGIPGVTTLEELIAHAATITPTAAQREAQRRSFSYGNSRLANDRITREMIDEMADRLAAEGYIP